MRPSAPCQSPLSGRSLFPSHPSCPMALLSPAQAGWCLAAELTQEAGPSISTLAQLWEVGLWVVCRHRWEITYLPGHLPPLFETLYKTPRSAVAGRTKAGWEEGIQTSISWSGNRGKLGGCPRGSELPNLGSMQAEPGRAHRGQRPLQPLPDSDPRTLVLYLYLCSERSPQPGLGSGWE